MNRRVFEIVVPSGLVMVGVGVGIQFGLGFGLIAGGCLVLGAVFALARLAGVK